MFVKNFLTKQEQERFALLENIYTYTGLLRAWVRSSLNEKTFNKYVEQMLQNDNLLVTFYCDDAFIRDKENMNSLPNMIIGKSFKIYFVKKCDFLSGIIITRIFKFHF